MLTFLTALPIGLMLIIAALTIVAARYFVKSRVMPTAPPVTVSPGAAQRLIKAALVGNKEALLMAAMDSLQIWINEGSIEQRLLELGFDDVQRRVSDPNGNAPVVKMVAHLLGMTEQHVLDAFKAEFLPAKPKPIVPALAVPVALFMLLCASTAFAYTPLPAPQRWYPPEPIVVMDSPTFYSPVSVTERSNVLLPNRAYLNQSQPAQQCPSAWYQTVWYQQDDTMRFWRQTGFRRFVSAPVRFLGRLRFWR